MFFIEINAGVANLTLEVPDGLCEIKYAYHVTNINAEHICPTWTFLKWTICDDKFFDGSLFTFPCVQFTTTLYKKDCPTISTYPRGGDSKFYWRVKLPMKNFSNYKVVLCHEVEANQKQVHLALIKPNSINIPEKWEESIEEARKYLIRINEKWYSNDYYNNKYFVNFAIFENIQLQDLVYKAEWDKVKHFDKTNLSYRQQRMDDNKNTLFEALLKNALARV